MYSFTVRAYFWRRPSLAPIILAAAMTAALAGHSLAGSNECVAVVTKSNPQVTPSEDEISFAVGVGAAECNDFPKALSIFRPLAEKGHGASQMMLGAMYYSGKGVRRDDREALKWFRPAAERGIAEAQFSLGLMYGNGQGVRRDYAEAAKWHQLAVAQGHRGAQYELGVMHANGQGVRQDYMEALRLYRLAALQGDRMAQNNLAALYYLGQGTAEDNVRAYMWFSLAFMNGMTRAGQNRDAIAGMMTPAEIAQAQDMAQQCSVSGYMQCE